MAKYPFSLVRNKNDLFLTLPQDADVLVYGRHPKAYAKCDYEGNTNVSLRPNRPHETTRWLFLGKDFDSVMAFHGPRERNRKNRYYEMASELGECFGK